MTMEIRPLAYFVAVYEERNLSLAARRVGVSQPSISAAMQALEATLGCPLLIRHAKGVTPTAAGEQLYPLAIKLLGDTEAIHRAVRELRRGARAVPRERKARVVREALDRAHPRRLARGRSGAGEHLERRLARHHVVLDPRRIQNRNAL